jgi:transcriptional regulator with XRE-family HTH domain
MSEFQKNIIENYLKEKKKTKRELAKLLDIKENSINRTLKNSNISISKLGMIAGFLEVDITDLLPKRESLNDSGEEYQKLNPFEASNKLTINNLSDAVNRNSKTIEQLVQIIAKHYTDRGDAEN